MNRATAQNTNRRRGIFLMAALAILVLVSGCSDDDECITCIDDSPPAVPTGVYSVTGDGVVTIIWDDLWYESLYDLDHYNVYWAEYAIDSCFPEHIQFMAQVDVTTDDDAGFYYYIDDDVDNGTTYYYAVSAVDANGNESCVSFADVYDTPRPEGYDVQLNDYSADAAHSGFDFSDLTDDRIDGDSVLADIRVEFVDDVPYVLAVDTDLVELQDYGSVVDSDGYVRLDWLDWAPNDFYSQTGNLELILGHAYYVKIKTGTLYNYAKFSVTNISGTNSVTIDWAYQPVDNLPELKATDALKTITGRYTTGLNGSIEL